MPGYYETNLAHVKTSVSKHRLKQYRYLFCKFIEIPVSFLGAAAEPHVKDLLEANATIFSI